jgi:hypothetical protein
MSIGLPSGVLSWLSVMLGVASGSAVASFRRHAAGCSQPARARQGQRDKDAVYAES